MPKQLTLEAGLQLALTVEEDSLQIHGAVRVRHATRRRLHGPILDQKLADSLVEPTAEIVLFVLDAKGEVLDQWGWALKMIAFSDRIARTAGGQRQLRGFPARFSGGLRLWRIPVRPAAAFLYFMRSDVHFTSKDRGRLVFERRPLALYSLGPLPDGIPSFPDSPLRLAELKHMARLPSELKLPPGPIPFHCRTLGTVIVAGDGTPDNHFNIVIVGDGFSSSTLAEYDRAVSVICAQSTGMLAAEPFLSCKSIINVWSVRSVSPESGITGCPESDAVGHSCYGVRGCYGGSIGIPEEQAQAYPGFVGAPRPELIYGAVDHALGLGFEQVDVYLVIANCAKPGWGSAFPDKKLAFVTMCPGADDLLVQTAAHECGHVIALLADEYIGCCPHDPTQTYPNQATLDQVESPQHIPWVALARPHELFHGRLIAIYRYPGSGDPPEGLAIWIAGEWLGAYWGCMDFDEGEPCNLLCDPYTSFEGKNFFRPMWDCRMRSARAKFCRVCCKAISDEIKGACGLM